MKKSLSFFFVLLIAGIAFVSLLQTTLLNTKDQVTYQDTVLLGDASMAEDLEIQFNTEYGNRLFWNTTYNAGEKPEVHTDYTFHLIEQDSYYDYYYGIDLAAYCENYSSSITGGDEDLKNLPLIYHDLYKSTSNHSSGTDIVYLKDYFDYYPIGVNIGLPDLDFSGWSYEYYEDFEFSNEKLRQREAFASYFRIPVLEDHAMKLKIDKESEGNYSTECSDLESGDSFYLSSFSAVGKDCIYFTFDPHTSNGNLIDTSLIQGGFGIYALPIITSENENIIYRNTVDFTKLSTPCSLNPEDSIMYLGISEDKEKLLLFTDDADTTGTKITVYDADTLEILQELILPAQEREDNATETLIVYDIYQYEDFMVLYCSGSYFVVLTEDESGKYQISLLTSLPSEGEIREKIQNTFYSDVCMDWNGKELAIVQPHYDYSQTSSFQLSIFDESGVVYFSEHISSLETRYLRDYGIQVNRQQTKEPSLMVKWTK